MNYCIYANDKYLIKTYNHLFSELLRPMKKSERYICVAN